MFEAAGLATVAIYIRAFRHVAEDMKVPRAVITPHPMGRPLGAPFDAERQRLVIRTALRLLDDATCGGTIIAVDRPYHVVHAGT